MKPYEGRNMFIQENHTYKIKVKCKNCGYYIRTTSDKTHDFVMRYPIEKSQLLKALPDYVYFLVTKQVHCKNCKNFQEWAERIVYPFQELELMKACNVEVKP
jgi:hypothetical protein